MNVPFACVLAAFALVYASKAPLAVAMAKEGRGYDNSAPRLQQARLTGWGQRAMAAHQNGFESFAPFAVAVALATIAHADPTTVARWCVVHVVARAVYPVLYIADIATLRSLVWSAGFAATVALYVLAAMA